MGVFSFVKYIKNKRFFNFISLDITPLDFNEIRYSSFKCVRISKPIKIVITENIVENIMILAVN